LRRNKLFPANLEKKIQHVLIENFPWTYLLLHHIETSAFDVDLYVHELPQDEGGTGWN
jgi:hypothetical protein